MTDIEDAATVVLVRPQGDPFQVFMLRRHRGHEFMANAWVFPGGRVDDRDRRFETADRIEGFDTTKAIRRLGGNVDASTALGIYVAALRETFEEAGLLLAHRRGDDEPVDLRGDEPRRHFASLRASIDDDSLTMAELCRREDLVLDATNLVYFAHWITPDFERRRYDTRFFLAPAPVHQQPSHDDGETTHDAWWTPNDAIARYRDGDILLAPPTLRILEQLADFDSIDDATEQLQCRGTPPTILPHPHPLESGDLALLLPGDPKYPSNDPKLAAAEPIENGVTRLIRRGDQWYSVHE